MTSSAANPNPNPNPNPDPDPDPDPNPSPNPNPNGAGRGNATLGGGGFDTPRHGKAKHARRHAEMCEHAVGARRPRLTDAAQEVQRQVGEPAHANQHPAQNLCVLGLGLGSGLGSGLGTCASRSVPRCQDRGVPETAAGRRSLAHHARGSRHAVWLASGPGARVARVLCVGTPLQHVGVVGTLTITPPGELPCTTRACECTGRLSRTAARAARLRHGRGMTHVSTPRPAKHTSTQRRRRWRRRTRKKVLSSTTDIHAT